MRFAIEGMTCGHCAGMVQDAVEAIAPGVSATVDRKTKTVEVTGTNNEEAVVKAVAAAGYSARKVAAESERQQAIAGLERLA
jgi:copper chaperone CopZ